MAISHGNALQLNAVLPEPEGGRVPGIQLWICGRPLYLFSNLLKLPK